MLPCQASHSQGLQSIPIKAEDRRYALDLEMQITLQAESGGSHLVVTNLAEVCRHLGDPLCPPLAPLCASRHVIFSE